MLSLIAVLAFAVGMRLGLTGAPDVQSDRLTAEAHSINVGQAFFVYLASFAIGSTAYVVSWLFPSVTQLIIALVAVKWIAVFLLGLAVLEQRKGYFYLGICV